MTQCARCFYNREMRAWGETFYACHYRLETKKEVYGSDDDCSGFALVVAGETAPEAICNVALKALTQR